MAFPSHSVASLRWRPKISFCVICTCNIKRWIETECFNGRQKGSEEILLCPFSLYWQRAIAIVLQFPNRYSHALTCDENGIACFWRLFNAVSDACECAKQMGCHSFFLASKKNKEDSSLCLLIPVGITSYYKSSKNCHFIYGRWWWQFDGDGGGQHPNNTLAHRTVVKPERYLSRCISLRTVFLCMHEWCGKRETMRNTVCNKHTHFPSTQTR